MPEQTERRRASSKQTMQRHREVETPEETDNRLHGVREHARRRRQVEKEHVPNIEESARLFQTKISEGPIYPCSSCERLMFRPSVVQLQPEKYTKILADVKDSFNYDTRRKVHDKWWICSTCHNTLKSGRTPTQSRANDLALDDLPAELQDLRPLELRLISQRIPFMKLVALPKGGQKAIRGSAVNVPSKLQSVTTILPRIPGTSQVVAMKLKRKLVYKGHYMQEYVRPKRLIDALIWLKRNNPLYKDVSICENWEEQWENDDADLWEAMTNAMGTVDEDDHAATQNMVQTQATTHRDKPCYQYPELQPIVARHSLSIVDVPADGNCFFHAVSKNLAVAGIQAVTGPEIRSMLVDHFNTEPSENYSDFIVSDGRESGRRRTRTASKPCTTVSLPNQWKLYISDLQKGAWADNVAVQGVADMLNINIRILNTITPDWAHQITPQNSTSPHTISIGLIGEQHYVSLKSDGTNGQEVSENVQDDARHQSEDAEDYIAFEKESKMRGIPYDTLLQEEDFSSDSVLALAPAENEKPCAFLADKHFEELANPSKYPYGTGGFSAERNCKITARKYFNQRILHADGRFAQDIDYLLAAQYTVESKQVRDDIQISLRQTRGHTFQNRAVNAGLLRSPANLQAMIQTDAAFRFLKNVRGSPAYWRVALLDLLAMLRQLGTPTWFLTLSAADMQWPEVIQSIARQYGQIFSDDEVLAMSWEEKCRWLRSNPVTAARQFQHRLEVFFKDFIGSKCNPIGELQDFMIRVEFQARGSPHAHTILWIKDAPKLDVDPDDVVTAFIGKYQTCAVPDEACDLRDLVLSRQQHVHSATCRRRGKCRFNFPHAPSSQTLISKPSDELDPLVSDGTIKRMTAVMEKVWNVMNDKDVPDDISYSDLLLKANVTQECYQAALSLSKTGRHVILKREPKERNINHYNPAILQTWKANMDLQYITDPYSCVMYVTSYMLKSERSMSELLRKVADECRGDDIKEKLHKLGTAFLNNREVSAQEAVYRLLSLPLKKSSRKVVFVNTSRKEKRVSMLKPSHLLDQLNDDDEDVFCTSLIDRYIARPDAIESMCLAEFAATFATAGRDISEGTEDHIPDTLAGSDDEEGKETNVIRLKNGLGMMRKRKKHCIIRFHREKSEGEEKYRILLMLYHPWRCEDADILGQFQSFQEHYNDVREEVLRNESLFSKHADEIDQAFQDLQDHGAPEHAWNDVAPNLEHDQSEQQHEGIVEERDLPQESGNADLAGQPGHAGGQSELHARFTSELDKSLMTPREYRAMMRNLNCKQKQMLFVHRKWCKDMIYALKHNLPTPVYRIFLSGPGGVGKSHLIKLVHYETMKLLKPLSGYYEPDELPMLLTAFTGTAAFGIEGMTLHSALGFACGPKSKKEYQSPSNDKLNTLRSRLSKMKLLVIDEVSMVGADLLYHIHRRLEDITGKSGPDTRFGDVSILAVGDLYQLQPVGQNHIFSLPSDHYAKLHGSLWEENFQLIELTESMRQREDLQFAELLMRVRTASCTEEDITLLKSREVSVTDPQYPQHALHVFKTNREVDDYNVKKLGQLSSQVYTIRAIDKKKDVQTGLLDVEISTKPSETGGLREVVYAAVGARTMVTVNIDVSDGLANGVCGTIVGVHSSGEMVHTILVEFDSDRVGRQAIVNSQHKTRYPKAVPISRQDVQFYTGRGRRSVEAKRNQFPLTLAWGCTIHKVQGKTLDQVVVSMTGKGHFTAGQAYVALSRVRKIEGLYILGFDATAIRANPQVHSEMERLRETIKHVPNLDLPVGASSASDITINLLNVRSYLEHIQDLKADSTHADADVLCLVETHLRPGQIISDTVLPDADVTRSEREDQAKGGIMIQTCKSLKARKMQLKIVGIEFAATTICKNGKLLNIITVYRSPSSSSEMFRDNLQKLLHELDHRVLTVVLGDFNYDLRSHPFHPVLDMMHHNGYKQHVQKPTTDYGSILDHVYTKGQQNVATEVMDTYYSDHDTVSISLKL